MGKSSALTNTSLKKQAEIDEEVADIALKAMYSEEERMEMAKGGMALPDGSYPIKDEEDLKNAIMAYGRAKDKTKAKAHIKKLCNGSWQGRPDSRSMEH